MLFLLTGLLAGLLIGSVARFSVAIAHEVSIAESVGGTLHIEPDDSPRAGEATTAWVALTQKGGVPIPLAACDCALAIYQQPRAETARPLLNPPLTPMAGDVSGGVDIPGATFTFPTVGNYSLVLSGRPKAAASADSDAPNFAPFELAFEVTVAAGQSAPAAPAAAKSSDAKSSDALTNTTTLPAPAPAQKSAERSSPDLHSHGWIGHRPVPVRGLAIALVGGVLVGTGLAIMRKRP
jgi:hypothetical protein